MKRTHSISDRLLRAFAAAAGAGSFTEAGVHLGVSQSAVSHAVAKLEAALGYPVLERSKAGVRLTPLGRILHGQIEGPLADLDAAITAALRHQLASTVSLSVSTSLASYWLMPRLPEFKRRHPDIELRLITTDSDRTVGLDDADLWIPLGSTHRGSTQREGLTSTFFCSEELMPVAAPNVAAGITFGDITQLRAAPLLELEERYEPRFNWIRWFTQHGEASPTQGAAYKTNDYSLVLQAALDGQGVALGWRHIVQGLLDSGDLVALAPAIQTDKPFEIFSRSNRPLSDGAEDLRVWLCEASGQREP